MSSEFAFDLDHIEQTTARARGFKEFVAERLEFLDRCVAELTASGKWIGSASQAYAAEHREWIIAAQDVVDGLANMESAARNAHDQYSSVSEINKRMTGG